MKRYRQFQPILISDFEVAEWRHPVHNHNHYELIYIKQGAGSHHINQGAIDYRQGNIFLLGPEEEHYFTIRQPTRFIYLKFTDLYLHQQGSGEYQEVQQLEYLLRSREARLSKFTLTPEDQHTVDQLFNVLISLKQDILRNEPLIWLQVMGLSVLLKRNLPEIIASSQQSKDMQAMFCYIHEHIYTPGKLKASVMADRFNTTADYIGPYFKRNAGVTLRDYIRDYRQSLIRKRIESGRYSLKQIAAEFGLTDESHVSKLLKKPSNK
jgi:YesN/AraC family two-component response regulator